jgi:hypothetical protein
MFPFQLHVTRRFSLALFFATFFVGTATTAVASLTFFLIIFLLAIVAFEAGTAVLRIHDASAHFIGGLAAFLRKDHLEGVALDDKMIHFVPRLASQDGIGVLDKGESFRLLVVIVAGNVNIAQFADAAKGLLEILGGNVGCHVAN